MVNQIPAAIPNIIAKIALTGSINPVAVAIPNNRARARVRINTIKFIDLLRGVGG
jgi:hypothetical protein